MSGLGVMDNFFRLFQKEVAGLGVMDKFCSSSPGLDVKLYKLRCQHMQFGKQDIVAAAVQPLEGIALRRDSHRQPQCKEPPS